MRGFAATHLSYAFMYSSACGLIFSQASSSSTRVVVDSYTSKSKIDQHMQSGFTTFFLNRNDLRDDRVTLTRTYRLL